MRQLQIETRENLKSTKHRMNASQKIAESVNRYLNTYDTNKDKSWGLVLCPYDFIDRKQGGAIRTKNIIRLLSEDSPIISISFKWDDTNQPVEIKKINETWIHIDIQHRGSILGYLKVPDFHFLNWYTTEITHVARAIAKNLKIDYLWLEYSYMAFYSHLANEFGCKAILSLQNIEWKLAKEILEEKKQGYLEPYGSWETIKQLEKIALNSIDAIVVTTDIDKNYCLSNSNINEITVAPNIISERSINYNEYKTQNLLTELILVGDFNYPPNVEGIKWFLKMIENYSKHNDNSIQFSLNVIGKGSHEILNEYSELTNIISHGYVDDLSKFYATADASLIPLRSGSGSRLKAYEAIEYCKPIITTSKGIEGINYSELSDYVFLFSNAHEFFNALKKLKKLKQGNKALPMLEIYQKWYKREQSQFKSSILNAVRKIG